ncbi:MAG: hypothetical protein Q9218_001113 [Villophora microphyllina]
MPTSMGSTKRSNWKHFPEIHRMASPQFTSKPALRINTRIHSPPSSGVHFEAPLRPRASTRGSPIESLGSSPPFLSPPKYDSASSDSEDDSRMRGRSSKGIRHVGLRPRFVLDHSLDSKPTGTPAVDSPVVPPRDPSAELDKTEQSLKESMPPERVHTNLFGMLSSSATFDDMTLAGFGGHRDTLATLAVQRVKHSKDLPIDVYAQVARYITFETYKSLRLVCRCWSAAFTYVRPLRFTPIYPLPAEIIKCVYDHLSPLDMDAARHTCRKWMIASLEYRLLDQILKQAGFWSSVEADAALNERLGHSIGGEWRLSKRIATECSLGLGWAGNGFTGRLTTPSIFHAARGTDLDDHKALTSLVLSSSIDFSQLVRNNQALRDGSQAKLHYTVSGCGRFLLVIHGSVIWVYCLQGSMLPVPHYRHGGYIELLVGIACPCAILAVSMDTSGDRYSIAALLADRRGLIIDVPDLHVMAAKSRQSSPHSEHDTRNISNTWDIKASPDATPTTSQRVHIAPGRTNTYYASPIEATPTSIPPWPTPLRFVPHTMYRNLCSKTSPPLTVAICPRRRCVAFGSSAGIELHWQDARTGQELSRWMELVGPAEHIHFLPLREQDDKALEQHLRLVSSRAIPIHYDDPVEMNEAWQYEKCKFLRAVPLKDGKHVLYTDPSHGDLYLGTGLHHAFGTPKPTKRFLLKGPEHHSEDRTLWPRCYKVGKELKWGVRIVAGFGEAIWLFSIPPDWLVDGRQIEGSLQGGVQKRDDGVIVVHGVQIASIPGLVELGVDASNGDLTIHTFSDCAPAQVYQIGRYPRRDVRERYIAPDGTVLDRQVDGGDSSMHEYAPHVDESAIWRPGGGKIKYTEVVNLDRHHLPNDVEGEDEDAEIEMRDFAVGDWVHNTEIEDEGYASDVGDDGARAFEGVWDQKEEEDEGVDGGDEEDAWAEGGEDNGWLGDQWPVMDLVRLEVEVLCGG